MQQRPDGKPEREISHRGMSRTACRNPIRRTLREDGVSEAVGAILLIAVIALGIGIFTVALFSQQAAPVLPSVTFNVTYGDNGSVAIRHQGGDMIPRDQLRIYIDNGTAVLGNEALTEGDDDEDWTVWGIGDILVYDPPEPLPGESEVLMVYSDRSGGEYLLHISEGWKGPIPVPTADPSPTGTVTATPTATATATATPTPAPVPLVANFTADITTGLAPLAIAFTDTSTGGPTSWSWNFGDGTVSSTRNPVHTYTTAGTYTVTLTASNADGENTETKTDYITVLEPPAAAFTANVTEGNAPLAVQFTDESTGNVTSWSWDFGDGNTSTVQNPIHTYESTGNYSVTLTASNAFGTSTLTKPDYIRVVPEESFINFVIDENVFVYGNALTFGGGNIYGPGATVIITGGLNTADTNLGASIAVTDIYIDGDVTLNGGGAGLGSAVESGSIYINGDLNLMSGGRDIYGDVYVSGNLYLNDARIHDNVYVQGKADLVGGEIYGDLYQGGDLYLKGAHTHGNVYVDGNVGLDWTPTVDGQIEYTGNLTKPDWYSQAILDKCIQTPHVPEVPSFEIPDLEMPPLKSADWHTDNGYVSGGDLSSDMKIFADSYSYTPSGDLWAENVVVIARNGDIRIEKGNGHVTGVFFAPKGKVTFSGASLEGVVIARDGFFVTSGGTTVTFKNLENYISDPDNYPF